MSKRKETIVINGVPFTLENHIMPSDPRYYRFRSLDSCYARPSRCKEIIYDEWENFFRDLGCSACECGISSYNCMQFSYNALFTYEGVKYLAYITKSYCRLYRVAD